MLVCAFIVCRPCYIADGSLPVLSPKQMRIVVSGDILALQDPKSAWKKHFHDVQVRSALLYEHPLTIPSSLKTWLP